MTIVATFTAHTEPPVSVLVRKDVAPNGSVWYYVFIPDGILPGGDHQFSSESLTRALLHAMSVLQDLLTKE